MRRIALVAAVVLAVLTVSSPVSAASGWTTPRRVWDADLDMPSIVVDGQGAMHIAARAAHGIWYLTNEGGAWARNRLARDGDSTSVSDPEIALDPSDGSLTVVYVTMPHADGGNDASLSFVTDRHPAGPGAWSTPRRIAGRGLSAPSVVVRDGVIAIAATAGLMASDVAFLTNASGHWTREDLAAPGERAAESPSLALDRQGRPSIAYAVHGAFPKANGIRLAVGSRRTGGFSRARVVAKTGVQSPSLVLAAGRPWLAYSADAGAFVARRTESGWDPHRVWREGYISQLLLGPDGRSRVVGLRGDTAAHAWYAAATPSGWQRTRLSSHPTTDVAYAVGTSGRNHVVTVVGDQLWYSHSR